MKNILPLIPCLSKPEIENALLLLKGWSYDGTNRISARFKFNNYAAACGFAMRVSLIAESQNHHPDVRFGWGYAEISLTTHDANGVSTRDIRLATAISTLLNPTP